MEALFLLSFWVFTSSINNNDYYKLRNFYHCYLCPIMQVNFLFNFQNFKKFLILKYFRGDYRWWWKSYLLSASVGLYIGGYAIYYYFTQLRLTRLSSIILYFGYMSLFSLTIILISGSIGFILTFLFLRKIYSMIKID